MYSGYVSSWKDKMTTARTCVAGLAAGVTINAMMLLTFRLMGFGWHGGGILLDPSAQSHKLIAVWTEMPPLPLVVSQPLLIVIGLIFFGVGHAFLYRWLAPAWPAGVWPRALRMALLIFFLSFVFWEFFTPFNQFGEPLQLILLELTFWLSMALAEALVMAFILEHGQNKVSDNR